MVMNIFFSLRVGGRDDDAMILYYHHVYIAFLELHRSVI